MNISKLTKHEIECGSNRVRYAERLILQLPENHDGRNSWLLNYGKGIEADKIRAARKKRREEGGQSFEDFFWDEETDCMKMRRHFEVSE